MPKGVKKQTKKLDIDKPKKITHNQGKSRETAIKNREYDKAYNDIKPESINVEELVSNIYKYIDTADLPLVAGFCLEYNISKDRLYDLKSTNKAVSDALKRLSAKKEVKLVDKGFNSKQNAAFPIFMLTQPDIAYTNKQEIQTDHNITVNIQIPRPQHIDILPENTGKVIEQECKVVGDSK